MCSAPCRLAVGLPPCWLAPFLDLLVADRAALVAGWSTMGLLTLGRRARHAGSGLGSTLRYWFAFWPRLWLLNVWSVSSSCQMCVFLNMNISIFIIMFSPVVRLPYGNLTIKTCDRVAFRNRSFHTLLCLLRCPSFQGQYNVVWCESWHTRACFTVIL